MKKIILIFLVLLSACRKEDIVPIPENKIVDIFSKSEATITNGDVISFSLTKEGRYSITFRNKETNQVLSKEVFNGKVGINNMTLYTKSLQVQYLYLTVEDQTKNQVGKTLIYLNK